jgi:hypothetical protein
MDAKSFVLGALAGVAGFAIVDRLLHSEPERRGASPVLAESSTDTAERALSATNHDALREPTLQREAPYLEEPPITPKAGTHDAENPGAAAADEADTGGTPRLEDDWPPALVGSDPRTAEKRAAEAKDVAWSYQTEQLLTQYLAMHPPAALFEIRSVDCRTTFCQIRAVSSHADAFPMWIQLSYDIQKQAWSEFGIHSTSGGKTTTGRDALILFLGREGRSP